MSKKSVAIAVAVVAALGFSGAASIAESLKYTIVGDGVPKSLTGVAGDPVRGRKAMVNRTLGNCLACHEISALSDEPDHGKVGPSLDGVADRWEEAQLRMLVINADEIFPQTIMPSFYRLDGLHRVAKEFKGKTILTDQQVEDVVAYLSTLKE